MKYFGHDPSTEQRATIEQQDCNVTHLSTDARGNQVRATERRQIQTCVRHAFPLNNPPYQAKSPGNSISIAFRVQCIICRYKSTQRRLTETGETLAHLVRSRTDLKHAHGGSRQKANCLNDNLFDYIDQAKMPADRDSAVFSPLLRQIVRRLPIDADAWDGSKAGNNRLRAYSSD